MSENLTVEERLDELEKMTMTNVEFFVEKMHELDMKFKEASEKLESDLAHAILSGGDKVIKELLGRMSSLEDVVGANARLSAERMTRIDEKLFGLETAVAKNVEVPSDINIKGMEQRLTRVESNVTADMLSKGDSIIDLRTRIDNVEKEAEAKAVRVTNVIQAEVSKADFQTALDRICELESQIKNAEGFAKKNMDKIVDIIHATNEVRGRVTEIENDRTGVYDWCNKVDDRIADIVRDVYDNRSRLVTSENIIAGGLKRTDKVNERVAKVGGLCMQLDERIAQLAAKITRAEGPTENTDTDLGRLFERVNRLEEKRESIMAVSARNSEIRGNSGSIDRLIERVCKLEQASPPALLLHGLIDQIRKGQHNERLRLDRTCERVSKLESFKSQALGRAVRTDSVEDERANRLLGSNVPVKYGKSPVGMIKENAKAIDELCERIDANVERVARESARVDSIGETCERTLGYYENLEGNEAWRNAFHVVARVEGNSKAINDLRDRVNSFAHGETGKMETFESQNPGAVVYGKISLEDGIKANSQAIADLMARPSAIPERDEEIASVREEIADLKSLCFERTELLRAEHNKCCVLSNENDKAMEKVINQMTKQIDRNADLIATIGNDDPPKYGPSPIEALVNGGADIRKNSQAIAELRKDKINETEALERGGSIVLRVERLEGAIERGIKVYERLAALEKGVSELEACRDNSDGRGESIEFDAIGMPRMREEIVKNSESIDKFRVEIKNIEMKFAERRSISNRSIERILDLEKNIARLSESYDSNRWGFDTTMKLIGNHEKEINGLTLHMSGLETTVRKYDFDLFNQRIEILRKKHDGLAGASQKAINELRESHDNMVEEMGAINKIDNENQEEIKNGINGNRDRLDALELWNANYELRNQPVSEFEPPMDSESDD